MTEPPRVLYISYHGLLEPLGSSQVVPGVQALAADHRLTVLSFEKPVRGSQEDARDHQALAERLAAQGIEWLRLRYHKRPSLPATLYDIAQGLAAASRRHASAPWDLAHARGYVPGAIAWGLKRLFGLPYLFDVRGLQAEEYVDAGHWSPRGVKFRLTKWMEQRILREADGLVTLTEAIRPALRRFPGLAGRPALPPWAVIPTCVDLDRFRFDETERVRRRAELGVGDHLVLVYAGSIGTWYLLEEMLACFAAARALDARWRLLLLLNGDPAPARRALRRRGYEEGREAFLRCARPEEVPGYLSAADAGIAFIRACFSKRSSSPTKYAEYLACGLPLIINAGVGDGDALVSRERAGVLVSSLEPETYRTAVQELQPFLGLPRGHFRGIAERQFPLHGRAVPAYRALYRQLLSRRPRKRVLFLTPYPPHCAPSQRLKFEQYYADFEAHGIEVAVSPFVSHALWRILYQRGHLLAKSVLTLAGYLRRLADWLRAGRFDAVYLHLWAVPFGPPWFEESLARRRIPVVYDIDDLIYLPRASSANAFLNRFRTEHRIARIMRAATHVIVSSEYLRRFALRHNPRSTVISSTIDTVLYQPRAHSSQTRSVTIGWSGSHSTSPYLHLLDGVLRQLARRFDIRLLVIGDARFRLEGVRVEARAWTLERETADLAEMDIGVYPLPNEEWVLGKSGLKALQYMGMGVPVVASAIGAARGFIRDGENGFLAGDDGEWVQRLSRLIEEPPLRMRMGRAGRSTVERAFSVQVTAPRYLAILESVMAGRPVPAAAPAGEALPQAAEPVTAHADS
jgi:glycosyltransferase involved in cell wall biosynthesis